MKEWTKQNTTIILESNKQNKKINSKKTWIEQDKPTHYLNPKLHSQQKLNTPITTKNHQTRTQARLTVLSCTLTVLVPGRCIDLPLHLLALVGAGLKSDGRVTLLCTICYTFTSWCGWLPWQWDVCLWKEDLLVSMLSRPGSFHRFIYLTLSLCWWIYLNLIASNN